MTWQVVLIEDDPSVRGFFGLLFSLEPDFDIVGEAASAEQGVEVVRATQPDLVVLDHHLAGNLTGLDVADDLRAAAPHTRILLCTALDMNTAAEEHPAIDAFLSKSRIDAVGEVATTLLRA